MGKQSFSNIEVVDAIKNNKADEVLGFLYKQLQPKIRKWIRNNNGSKEESQDIFQDSILVFYSYVVQDKFDVEANLEAFIFKIAKNKWINYVSKNKRISPLDKEIEFEADYEQEITRTDSQKVLEALFGRLGEVCKEILTYTIFYKISMEDVCVRLGFNNPNTAKTKNYKCKQRLKKLINENPEIKHKLLHAR